MFQKEKWIHITLLTSIIAICLLSSVAMTSTTSSTTWDPSLSWDFQCHSHTHPHLQNLTPDEIRLELEQVDNAFLAQGYQTPSHHAYPYGGYDDKVKAVVAEYRLTGRMVWGFMMNHPVLDWYEMKAAQLKRTTSWNRIVGWVEDCIADKALLHMFTHDVSDTCSQYGCTPDKLAQVLDYLLEKQSTGLLEIVTMAEAYDYWITATEGKAMVVVSFDDAYDTDYTTVYPMFRERGIKGTSYIPTGFIGEPGYLTWEMIDEMRTGTSPPPKPDLTLTTEDIGFDPETPSEGEMVTISATIHNIGEVKANNIIVNFYDGIPSTENFIDTETIIQISSGATEITSTSWDAVSGNHNIYVVVDPDNTIFESNENNNEAYKLITILGEGGIMHVFDIEITCSSQGPFYRAHTKVTIVDANDSPVEGVEVYGSWSDAYTGDVSGTTDAYGQVTLDSGKVKGGGTFIFTVTNIEKIDWTYNPQANIETNDSITCP